MSRLALAAGLVSLVACASGVPEPVALDTRNDPCASCRMAVSDARFAGQVVAPGEEPRFFDDIGCLSRYLGSNALPGGAVAYVAYVADHRTRVWVAAASAVYTRVGSLETPMGSHLVAHADAASRDADPEARGGVTLAAADVLGKAGLAGGARP